MSGLDPAASYTFRVSPWNEAGNGDWITSTPLDYTTADVAFSGVENTAVTFDTLDGDTGTAVPTGVGLVGGNGDVQSTLTVDGQGTYVVNPDHTSRSARSPDSRAMSHRSPFPCSSTDATCERPQRCHRSEARTDAAGHGQRGSSHRVRSAPHGDRPHTRGDGSYG